MGNAAQHSKKYRLKHRARLSERQRVYRANNLEKVKAAQRKFIAKPEVKKRRKARNLLIRYQITLEVFDRLYLDQCGCCAICAAELDAPHVDHDHKTGKVRGLLCKYCNTGLGLFKDRPGLLRRAANYLEKNR